MPRNKGPLIYPIHSVRLSFEKGSPEIHVSIGCQRLKNFGFVIPEHLKEKLKDIDWKSGDGNKIVARYSRDFSSGAYLSRGIKSSEELGQTLENLFHEAIGEKGYSAIRINGDEYLERRK